MDILLKGTSEQLLHIFDALTIPVLFIDEHGAVTSANTSAGTVFQYPENHFKGRRIGEFMSLTGEMRDAIENGGQGFGKGNDESPDRAGLHFESTCRKKNGDEFAASITVIPRGADSQKLVVIRDISDQRRLQQRASQRRKDLFIFNTMGEILNTERGVDEMFRESLDVLTEIMGVESGWIHILDEESGRLVLKAQRGYDRADPHGIADLGPGECLPGKVLASGRPLLAKNAPEDPRVTHVDTEGTGFRSIASVPVSSRGIVSGVISLASTTPSYFTSMDMQVLTSLGTQLGVALENSRLIRQLREKMNHITLINELSGTINSSLSIGTLFRIMVSEIRRFVKYDRASLLLYDEKSGKLLIFALDTEMKTVMPKGVRAPLEGTSAGWVFQHNQPWINHDLDAEIRFKFDRKLHEEGIRSTISIPLYQDKMLGVFNLDSKEPGKYSEKDLELLLPVSKHISIALENALLFEEISKEKKEWEKTFDAITDMVWIEDIKQEIIRANSAILNKIGSSVAEVSGMSCCQLLGMIGLKTDECLCSETMQTHRPAAREIQGKGGSIFHFWSYPLIDDDGNLYAIVHYLKDVTQQKMMEQQLVRADKLASLGTLSAGIAHEINNPLGIIAGYSEALLDRARNKELLEKEAFEDFPEYLNTIHNEIFRCKEILESLLEFSRPQKGKARELDINELIKEVMLLVNYRAKSQHYDIKLSLNRDLPKICADPGSLRQLFMNIIMNSMYFTPEGGSIEIRSSMNRDGARRGMIKISISDSGAGMSKDIVNKIFDPFFTTKPPGEGTGLGLAISHKIAQEHDGFIDVKSEVGKGTTFIINLPAKGVDDQAACC